MWPLISRYVSATPPARRQFLGAGGSPALTGADIVVAATDSSRPVFDGRDVEPGTHVNGVDSYRPDMQEVAVGAAPGRVRDDEITFFTSVGNVVQDLAVGSLALESARERGLGTRVEL